MLPNLAHIAEEYFFPTSDLVDGDVKNSSRTDARPAIFRTLEHPRWKSSRRTLLSASLSVGSVILIKLFRLYSTAKSCLSKTSHLNHFRRSSNGVSFSTGRLDWVCSLDLSTCARVMVWRRRLLRCVQAHQKE